jgi:hypothetical protein
VPLASLEALLAAADVHLITLRSSFSGIVLPSKIYACIESRRSILFVGPASSDVHLLCVQTVEKPCVRVEPGDPDGFAKALEFFADAAANPTQSIELKSAVKA